VSRRLEELERERALLEAQLAACPSSASSCRGRCGAPLDRSRPCQCNTGCQRYSNCCVDHTTVCSSNSSQGGGHITWTPGRTTDADLRRLSEALLDRDQDNVATQVELELGCTTRNGASRDCSPRPLFKRLDQSVLRRPLYRKLMAMYENYEVDTTVRESVSRAETQEEEAFLQEVTRSTVMQEAIRFLKAKNLLTKSQADFTRLLKELWFALYSRGNRILGSSGFEHVFLGEKKQGQVQGFHNWVYFYHLEKQNKVNYLGHWEAEDLGGKGTGLTFTFKWGSEQKPHASMLVGTSPSLELALYTVCVLARGDQPCHVRLGGKLVTITTHVFNRPGGVRHVASSFMTWK